MSTATDLEVAPADTGQVVDRYARALAVAPEAGCATEDELAAMGEAVAWIATGQPRDRLRWLVESGLERAARMYLEATPTPAQRSGSDSWVFDPREPVRPDARWAASTVAALLTIRANGGTAALTAALATIVDNAGPDDLWHLLTETARTWGHLLSTVSPPTGRVPST